jgi:hypothetical protein
MSMLTRDKPADGDVDGADAMDTTADNSASSHAAAAPLSSLHSPSSLSPLS